MIRIILSIRYIKSELVPPPFQNLKDCGLHLVISPSQPISPAASTIVSLDEDRRDASQKYYIGYRYVAQSDKDPVRGPADSVVSRSRWNRGPLLFSQPSISMTQPPDGHSRQGTRSSSSPSSSSVLSRRREKRCSR